MRRQSLWHYIMFYALLVLLIGCMQAQQENPKAREFNSLDINACQFYDGTGKEIPTKAVKLLWIKQHTSLTPEEQSYLDNYLKPTN